MFYLQTSATGQVPIEISATNSFNTTKVSFGVTVKEITETLNITRTGQFTFTASKTFEFEKTTAQSSSSRRILDETNGAVISGPVYTMTTSGTSSTNNVKIANIWGRGDLLGTLVCKGGLFENGEQVSNSTSLGDISNPDTIVDLQIKSPVGAVISVSQNSPPKYFLNVYKEPEILRARHLLSYTCTSVAVTPSSDYNYAYSALYCENKILVKRASVSPGTTSSYSAAYSTANQVTKLEIFRAVQSGQTEGVFIIGEFVSNTKKLHLNLVNIGTINDTQTVEQKAISSSLTSISSSKN